MPLLRTQIGLALPEDYPIILSETRKRQAIQKEPHMSELSRDEVIKIIGKLDDAVVAEIIATGITSQELVAAHDRVVKDIKTHDHGPMLKPGHVARVVGILERLKANGALGSPLGEAGSTLE
jgi:hypothetical protein